MNEHQDSTAETPSEDDAPALTSPITSPVDAPVDAPVGAAGPPVPPRPRGPHAPAILLGLVCLAIAALVLAQELGGLKVDWGNVGPLGITVAGGVLVLLGVLGLAASRRRSGS